MKEISTADAPHPSGAYSQGIEAGPFVFSAGMGPHDPVTAEVVGVTIEEQTAQALKNVKALLGSAGLSLEDVVKVTAHLQNLERDFAGYDRVYRTYFRDPYPVRTTVGSDLGGILIELDAVALRRA